MRRTRVLLISFIAAASFSLAAASRTTQAASTCVAETLRIFEWTPTTWHLFGIKVDPNLPNRAALDWSRVSEQRLNGAVEFALGYCDLRQTDGDLQSHYRFRPLSEQLREEMEIWHQSPFDRAFIYSLSVALMESSSQARALIGPLVISNSLEFLRRLAQDAPIPLNTILARNFSLISFEPRPVSDHAQVLKQNELNLSIWPDLRSLLFLLFHELVHASPDRAALVESFNPDNAEEEEWVRLTVVEEYRAQVLTYWFQTAWQNTYPQYGSKLTKLNELELWDRFLKNLQLPDPIQARVIRAFLKNFEALPETEKLEKLRSWIFIHG